MNPELLSGLISATAGIIGAILGAVISYYFYSKRKKKYNTNNAIELLFLNRPEEWNEIRILNPNWIPDFRNAKLDSLDLPLINFKYANLAGTSFINSILDGADLSNANLSNANFSNATLTGANLDKTNLIGAVFENTKIENATIENAIIEEDKIKLFKKQKSFDKLRRRPNFFKISPSEFEKVIAELFINENYQVKMRDPERDKGYDIIATKKDPIKGEETLLIEVKRTPKNFKVGLSSLRSLYAGLQNTNANQAVLVTTTDLTQSAQKFAEVANIRVINGEMLQKWMKQSKASS